MAPRLRGGAHYRATSSEMSQVTPPPSTETIKLEDIGSNPVSEQPVVELIARRLHRRGALRSIAGAAAAMALADQFLAAAAPARTPPPAHSSGNTPGGGTSSLTFTELAHQMAEGVH